MTSDPTAPEPAPIPLRPNTATHAADARDLCRSLIQGDPTVRYRDAVRVADGLGLPLTRQLFASVHREIAGTVRGEEPLDGAPAVASEPGRLGDPERNGNRPGPSAMDFMVAHLRARPEATYQEVRTAAEAEHLTVFPITYGRARTLAGLPKASRARGRAAETSPAVAFTIAILKEHPDAAYREVKARAAEAGHAIFPIIYGKARKLAGIPIRPASTPALPRKSGAPVPARSSDRSPATMAVTNFIELVQRLEHNRRELREALAQIDAIARTCLVRLK